MISRRPKRPVSASVCCAVMDEIDNFASDCGMTRSAVVEYIMRRFIECEQYEPLTTTQAVHVTGTLHIHH